MCLREIIKKEDLKRNKEINASKIYSPVANLAERAKKVKSHVLYGFWTKKVQNVRTVFETNLT